MQASPNVRGTFEICPGRSGLHLWALEIPDPRQVSTFTEQRELKVWQARHICKEYHLLDTKAKTMAGLKGTKQITNNREHVTVMMRP